MITNRIDWILDWIGNVITAFVVATLVSVVPTLCTLYVETATALTIVSLVWLIAFWLWLWIEKEMY